MESASDDVFLSLPSELTNSILLLWLDLECIAALDSAYCNTVKRKALILLLTSPHFVVTRMKETNDQFGLIKWLHKRDIRVERLVICDCVESLFIQYVAKFGLHVHHIHLNRMDFLESDCDSNDTLQVFSRCPNMRTLIFDNCCMSKAIIEVIHTCHSVEELYLKECTEVEDENINSINFTNVSKLPLSFLELNCDTSSAQALLKSIDPSALRFLQVIWFESQVTEALQDTLRYCSNLEALSIQSEDELFDDSCFGKMMFACPHIQHLALSGCSELTDACASTIGTLTRLKTIDISCTNLSDAVLYELAEHHRDSLESLCMDDCEVQGEALNTVLRRCTHLKTLRITATDECRFDLSLLCNITALTIECDGGHREFLQRLADSQHCKKLEFLGVLASEIKEKDFMSLSRQAFPALRALHLYCLVHGDVYVDLGALRAQRPELQVRWDCDLVMYNLRDVF